MKNMFCNLSQRILILFFALMLLPSCDSTSKQQNHQDNEPLQETKKSELIKYEKMKFGEFLRINMNDPVAVDKFNNLMMKYKTSQLTYNFPETHGVIAKIKNDDRSYCAAYRDMLVYKFKNLENLDNADELIKEGTDMCWSQRYSNSQTFQFCYLENLEHDTSISSCIFETNKFMGNTREKYLKDYEAKLKAKKPNMRIDPNAVVLLCNYMLDGYFKPDRSDVMCDIRDKR